MARDSMNMVTAIKGAIIFDGETRHNNSALIIQNGTITDIVHENDILDGSEIVELKGGLLAPGFVDLQVNGGGGLLFNDNPTIDTIKTICAAHMQYGTTALMPTIITDKQNIISAAIEAAVQASFKKVSGFLGLHLEGPHLSGEKKGAHDDGLMRQMTDHDLKELLQAKSKLGYMMVTIAPESVSNHQIKQLSNAGIVVSLGHTNTTYDNAITAVEAGASCVTHLFNGMSGLNHREPGLVGAALNSESLYAGLIADGFHVDPAAISVALRAKGAGKIFLVTDSMPTIGSDISSFTLNGRLITKKGGRLVLENGSLAGADLDMISAVKFMTEQVCVEFDEALRMASLYPARCIGADDKMGHLKPGAYANIVHLNNKNDVKHVWIDGTLMVS